MGMPANPLPHMSLLPGTLLPVAFRLRNGGAPSTAALALVDFLVTAKVPMGTALSFRWYPSLQGYQSADSVTLAFSVTAAIPAGTFLRVQRVAAPGTGTILLWQQYAQGSPVAPVQVGATPVVLGDGALGWSCFGFCTPRPRSACCAPIQALCAVAGQAPGADLYLPPTCLLPCQFAIVPTTAVSPASDFVSVPLGAVPGAWYTGGWQAVKYTPWSQYQEPAFPYGLVAAADQATGYIAPNPGAVVPVAFRPHAAQSPCPAQLVLVVTETLPAGTVLQVSATAETPPMTACWMWTSPATCDLPPGTVIDMNNLSVLGGAAPPAVSVGTLQALLSLDEDIALTEFTVFSEQLVGGPESNTQRYVTALYTCARPPGIPLPPCLVAGTSAPAAPWPASPTISTAAVAAATAPCNRRSVPWLCRRLRLLTACVVPWVCQPVPWFPVADPCGCVGVGPCAACAACTAS